MEDQVGMMTTLMTVLGFVLCIVLLGAGGFCIMSGMNEGGDKKQADVENQVAAAA